MNMDATWVGDYVNNCQTCLYKRLAHGDKKLLNHFISIQITFGEDINHHVWGYNN